MAQKRRNGTGRITPKGTTGKSAGVRTRAPEVPEAVARARAARPQRPDAPREIAIPAEANEVAGAELTDAGRGLVRGLGVAAIVALMAAVVLFTVVGGIGGIVGGVVLVVAGLLGGLFTWFLSDPSRAMATLNDKRRTLKGQLGG